MVRKQKRLSIFEGIHEIFLQEGVRLRQRQVAETQPQPQVGRLAVVLRRRQERRDHGRLERVGEFVLGETLLLAGRLNRVEGAQRVEIAMVLAVGTIFLAIVQFLILQREVPNVFPLLLIIVLELPMFEFGLALPQFFLFWRFIELLLGANERQLIFLLVFVLEVLQDRVDVVTAALDSTQPRSVVLHLVDLLEDV